jgi:hypothetical protein
MASKTTIILSTIILAGAAVWIYQSNFSAPKDYEECIEDAAKTAKSQEALNILVQSCDSKFRGRRNPGGGYTYFDARQDRAFRISGPNPSQEELDYIENQYAKYLDNQKRTAIAQADLERRNRSAQAELERKNLIAQAEQQKQQQLFKQEIDRRRRVAQGKLAVTSNNIECTLSSYCGMYKITVGMKNESAETVSAVSIGWAFLSGKEASCPTSLPTKHRELVSLKPGQTTVLNIDGLDGPNNAPVRFCTMVTDVEISP